MPWSPNDATRFTKKARSATGKKRWAAVADNVLERTGDEGRAVRSANAAVKRGNGGKRAELARGRHYE